MFGQIRICEWLGSTSVRIARREQQRKLSKLKAVAGRWKWKFKEEADSKPFCRLYPKNLHSKQDLWQVQCFPDGLYSRTNSNEVISSLYEFWETGDIKVLNKIKIIYTLQEVPTLTQVKETKNYSNGYKILQGIVGKMMCHFHSIIEAGDK